MNWKDIYMAVGIVAVFLVVAACVMWGFSAYASTVLEEAEKEGVDLLYASLAALATAVVGWVVKRPQDMLNGKKTDALAEHEKACAERYGRIEERMGRIETDIGWIKQELSRFLGTCDR